MMTLILNGWIGDGEIIISSEKNIIQVGETSELTALVKNCGEGVTVEFYEVVTPTLTMSSNKSIIQTGETAILSCKVRDEDGSIVRGQTVEFYKEV